MVTAAALAFAAAPHVSAQDRGGEDAHYVPEGQVTHRVETARPAPRLIVAISVDQFSADLFAEYRPYFTGGLKRLSEGAAFPSGYQAHAATETCPGHSTILTGAYPAHTGIIANRWFDLDTARGDKRIYCAEDESVAGSNSSRYTASSVHLLVPTLGERLKAKSPLSRNIAVSGKDRAVIMMGGHDIDQAWWWGGDKFVSFTGAAEPAAVTRANSDAAAAIARPREGIAAPAFCAGRNAAIPVSAEQSVGTYDFARPAGQPNLFRVSPEIDGATLELAGDLAEANQLGRDDAVDVLSVSLSATDYVGHAFGTEGLEMCIQMSELDRQLGEFFTRLDRLGLDYVVVLTADHGGHDLPERLRRQASPDAARVDPALDPEALGPVIAAELGLTVEGPLLAGDGPFGDMYISHALSEGDRARVLVAVREKLAEHDQVAAVFSHDELAALPLPKGPPERWSLADRARASFHPDRSGDYVVLLKKAVTPIAKPGTGYVATHGSPWDYDRRVPILFWRKGMTGFEHPLGVMTVDIAPTLAALVGLDVPDGEFDGRCLDLDGGEGSTCD